jgi:2-polyprenyl-3-methyl-5-hydroxy-6-metoxy-1,4-benzoquinol methylase
MGAVERLTLEAVSAHSLIAAEHIHRYELAAELCGGLRVLDLGCGSGYGSQILGSACPIVVGIDNDAATIDMAEATIGREGNIEFEVADAHDVLTRELSDQFDVIVLLETLEHLANPDDAVGRLRDHADNGLKIVLSVPNAKALAEDNPYHLSSYGYEDAVRLRDELAEASLLFQFLAEGSVIRGTEVSNSVSRLVASERGEPEYANHFIICANFGEAKAIAQASSRMHVEAAPVHNRYVSNLERANAELRLANAKLTRSLLGKADSAAASLVAELEATRGEVDRLRKDQKLADEARAHELWIQELHDQIASRNAQIAMMESSRVWRLAGRWWRLRDRLRRRG